MVVKKVRKKSGTKSVEPNKELKKNIFQYIESSL